jgi:hypothetical protein
MLVPVYLIFIFVVVASNAQRLRLKNSKTDNRAVCAAFHYHDKTADRALHERREAFNAATAVSLSSSVIARDSPATPPRLLSRR